MLRVTCTCTCTCTCSFAWESILTYKVQLFQHNPILFVILTSFTDHNKNTNNQLCVMSAFFQQKSVVFDKPSVAGAVLQTVS